MTCAPASLASWIAKRPTPPDAPVTSTRLPSTSPARSSARSAVRPATGSVAACSKEIPSGSSASTAVETAASCAQPVKVSPTTRAPAGGPEPSAAACSTTPATSQPVRVPGGVASRRLTSPRLRLTARTATTASSRSGLQGRARRRVRRGSGEGGGDECAHATQPISRGPRRGRCENRAMQSDAPPGPVAEAFAARPSGVGGAAAVAAGGALVPGPARPRRARLRAAHAAAARPRPDRALQGVSAPEPQDAGLRRAARRPLPHAADPHARGHPDRAHRRPRAGPQRGPRRGDRARPRPRAPAVRARRRGVPRPAACASATAPAFATTSTRCGSSRCWSATTRA